MLDAWSACANFYDLNGLQHQLSDHNVGIITQNSIGITDSYLK